MAFPLFSPRRLSLWFRQGQLLIGWLTLFVIGTDLFVVSPLLPLVAGRYQISAGVAGWMVTAFSVMYMLAAPCCGLLADRLGRRSLLVAGLLGFAVANSLTGLASSFPWLLGSRLLAGGFLLLSLVLNHPFWVYVGFTIAPLFAQTFLPAQQARLVQTFPGRRALLLAWNNSALYLGIALGSAIGGILLSQRTFAGLLVGCSGIGIVGCVANLILPNHTPQQSCSRALDNLPSSAENELTLKRNNALTKKHD
ncbi:MFS transporter [Dictyobacter formicarum]|uniref:Major facilitator superfamily (MFS) profile domain-containing protein n=1 Tax=Dictyobacter formicarum TaxID=2778368 RepID=A0ABQ3VSG6_9CHLR|nr:MFS transporter [Dictyobacter formicarum]GHO88523.1 hypothetical protein KSZ_65290 [Dictyobacter formicarum]